MPRKSLTRSTLPGGPGNGYQLPPPPPPPPPPLDPPENPDPPELERVLESVLETELEKPFTAETS